MTADDIIAHLNLAPHPEGGHYRQTWAEASGPADAESADTRPRATAIHFLLKAGEKSHWHKVDADEIWFWHGGAPLELRISETDQGPSAAHLLGSELSAGQSPQILVPRHHWQTARSLGPYTLVSCVVSPGFRFDGFTLAAPGFDIP